MEDEQEARRVAASMTTAGVDPNDGSTELLADRAEAAWFHCEVQGWNRGGVSRRWPRWTRREPAVEKGL